MRNYSNLSMSQKYKYCIVPLCKSSTSKTPEKLWFSVPKNSDLRKKWCIAMNRDEDEHGPLSNLTSLFCCQDHFCLEEDMDNYWEFKLTKHVTRLRVKPDVVPHIFTCQNPNKEDISETEEEIKLKRHKLIKQAEEDLNRIAIQENLNSLVEVEYDIKPEEEIVKFHDKGIQVNMKKHFRSKAINVNFPNSSFGLTPQKPLPPRSHRTEEKVPTKYILLMNDTPNIEFGNQTYISPVYGEGLDGLNEYIVNVNEVQTSEVSTKSEITTIECLFMKLITHDLELTLPSSHWILSKNEDQSDLSKSIINFLKLVLIDGRDIVEKQINLTIDSIKCYIFNYQYNSPNCDEIQSAEDLDRVFKDFDELSVCYGGVPLKDCPKRFKSQFYYNDSVSGFLRHNLCKYTTTSMESKTCNLCQRSFRFKKALKFRAALSKEFRKHFVKKMGKKENRTRKRMRMSVKREKVDDLTLNEQELESITIKDEELDIKEETIIKMEPKEVTVKIEPMNEELL